MAPNPPPSRKRASNASRGPGQPSRHPLQANQRRQPRNGTGSGKPAASKKRNSSGGGRLSTQGNTGKQRQSTIRESLGAPSRQDAQSDDDEVEEEEVEVEEVEEEEQPDSGRARKRGRPSNVAHGSSQGGTGVIGRRGIPQPNQPGSRSHGKQQAAPEPDADREESSSIAPPSPPKPYVHVAPHTRRVRQSAIEAKWSPLANASLTAVSTTLQHAQRPILQRLADSKLRREHTSSALRLISHRITRRISRGLPFPPASMPANVGRAPLQSDGGREVELNFESVLDGKLNLERQLVPALDGLEVLRREREAMEKELEMDYETLRNLEAGARAQAREQRSLLRKAHALTPAAGKGKIDDFELTRDDDAMAGGAFTEIKDDDEIQPLAMQLKTHVDNIRTNLKQTDGLLPQLVKSRAALRAVLLRHLDIKQYEQIVLG